MMAMLARQQNFLFLKKKSCYFLLILDSMCACLHALIWTIEYNVGCKKKILWAYEDANAH